MRLPLDGGERSARGEDALHGEPSVALRRRPSFDDVQNLSGVHKFFPAREFKRQTLYPVEVGGNYPLRLGFCPAQLDLNSRRSVLVQTVQNPFKVA
jgi:hypothetical protein